jgi:hypothetical protein
MEKAAVAGIQAGRPWEASLGRCTAATLAAIVVAPALQAQDVRPASAEVLVAEARADQPQVRVQVRTSSLPRIDPLEPGFQAPRVDLSLTPRHSYGLGAVVGMSGFTPPHPQALGLQPQRANVDLGLRWSQRHIDVMAWRRMNTPEDAYALAQLRDPPLYGARVEMNLSAPRKSGFALDRGFIGMQLESGARISIKRKDGRPMVYYRTTF